MKPNILHIETSERLCSVCFSAGEQCVTIFEDDLGDHQSTLAINIKNILIHNNLIINNLDAISVNIGPGSYTSLRVGVIMAKGLAAINHIPLIALTGLKVLAFESSRIFPEKEFHIPLIDARREDVYYAIYDRNNKEWKEPQFASLSSNWFKELGIDPDKCVISGSGSSKWDTFVPDYQTSILKSKLRSQMLIQPAIYAFEQKDFASPSELKPFYLKDPNITTAKKKL